VVARALAPWFFTAAGLLVLSGVGKLRSPGPAGGALRAAGLGVGDRTARALGAAEALVGFAGLLVPRPAVCLAVAVLYAGFAAFLVRLRRRGGVESCGCLGSRPVSPSLLHAGLDLVAATAAVLVGLSPLHGLIAFAGAEPFHGVPAVAGMIALGWVAWLTVTLAPRALGSYRPT